MNYRFSTEAQRELADAAAFYESRRVGLGSEFAVEVGIAIARILETPGRWPEVEPGVRKYRLDRFPYGIFYQTPAAQLIETIAVFDLRRDPNGWRDRLS